MYAELGEDIYGTSSFDNSAKIEKVAGSLNGGIMKGKAIKKSSELRKSLMDDGSGADLESGIVNGSQKKGISSLMESDDDPYYVFKEDVLIKLDLVEDGLERYERIIKTTDTVANKAEVKDEKKQLKRHIKNAESTFRDLQTTVRMVENKPDKFPDISNAELSERNNFTILCNDRIKRGKDGMNSQIIKTKMLKDQRSFTKRRLGLAETRSEDEGEKFIENNQASTQLMMEQQDETLDHLDDAVVRVGYMADNIHEELGQQNKKLNELEGDLENAEEQLGMVMGKLAKMLKTKSKWQLCTILTMSAIVIVLLVLVIYT